MAKRKTKAGPARAKAGAKPPPGKAIVLFSDGTGNSSAKQFKTNVWRMYEAVDLGETAIDPEQIVCYDEGVGNSGFKPLAILGGVFGWGLKRNVIDLYSFLCRNYEEGDRIYAFGFSRGAFTIRVLVGLIASQGVVRYRDEADLVHQAADAYRAAIRDLVPRFPPMRWLLPLWRGLVGLFLGAKRRLLGQRRYSRAANHQPRIRFVGLWDTVAAYGGPIIELVRAFDDWIRPLTFKDTTLSDKVDCGRHALALDDERDAFQPVPWDEPVGTDRERIKQVWFAGAHADVGGGYPDDSLAFVSLAWMMEEAAAADLALREDKVVETNRIANAFGPIHDPRAGLGSYYRYQPRIVGAYVEPPVPGTESMEDPVLHRQGLDQCAWVHQSVFYRIEAGTDGYAPITLPRDFRVVDHSPADADFPAAMRANLAAVAAERADRQESLRDQVWFKRVFYFAIVGVSLVIASMPLWAARAWSPLCGDERCVLGTVIGWFKLFVPALAEPWIDAIAAAPILAGIFLLLILILRWRGGAAERRMRDGTRALWQQALDGRVTMKAEVSGIRSMRTSAAYQSGLGFIKWHALPFLLGLVMLVVLVWAAAIAMTQARLAVGEGRGLFACALPEAGDVNFRTADPCTRMPLPVYRNQVYEVRFYLREAWRDGGHATDPAGLPAASLAPPLGHVAAPFRRVIGANYLQPLVAISTGLGVNIEALRLTPRTDGSWGGEFTAAADGQLNLFVNDAVPPWPFDPAYFYVGERGRNAGSACVTISRRDGDALVPIVTCQGSCETAGQACVWRVDPKAVPPRTVSRRRR